jgi:hypothetical protein
MGVLNEKRCKTLGIFDENDVQQIGQNVAGIVNSSNKPQFTKYYMNVPGVNSTGGKKTKKNNKSKTSKKTKKNNKSKKTKKSNKSKKI